MEDGKQVLDPMLVFWIVEWWTRDSILDIIRHVLDAVGSTDVAEFKVASNYIPANVFSLFIFLCGDFSEHSIGTFWRLVRSSQIYVYI